MSDCVREWPVTIEARDFCVLYPDSDEPNTPMYKCTVRVWSELFYVDTPGYGRREFVGIGNSMQMAENAAFRAMHVALPNRMQTAKMAAENSSVSGKEGVARFEPVMDVPTKVDADGNPVSETEGEDRGQYIRKVDRGNGVITIAGKG